MLKHMLRPVTALSLICVILFGCEGPTGPQGEQGPPGEAGSATVLELQFSNDEFEYVTGYGEATREVEEITEAVVSEGYVMAYVWEDDRWQVLPRTLAYYNLDQFSSETFSYDVGTFTMELQFQPGDSEPNWNPLVKVVVVE